MIRILHFADLHLGVENHGRIDPATGVSTRLQDFLDTFDEAIDYAVRAPVDLVLFCGDAYKSRDPSPTHQREFARRIVRLVQAGIPVFLLIGNHDLPNAIGRATSIEIFQTVELPNVHLGNRVGLHRVETPNGPIQVIALPWLLRSALFSKEEHKNKTLEELNQALAEAATTMIAAEAESLDPRLPAVLAGHAIVPEARLGAERAISLGQQYTVMRSALARPELDYVALGHVHRYQILGTTPPVVYSGSLQRVDFGEEDEPDKGFVVVEIAPRPDGDDWAGETPRRPFETTFQLVPVQARRFLTVEVTADGEDPTADVLRAIERSAVADAIVRVQIRVPERKEELLDEAAIRHALKDAYHVAAVAREVVREHRTRGGNVEQLPPTEALKAYFKAKQVSAERQSILLDHARKLLGE